jgi:hypothetical protein
MTIFAKNRDRKMYLNQTKYQLFTMMILRVFTSQVLVAPRYAISINIRVDNRINQAEDYRVP